MTSLFFVQFYAGAIPESLGNLVKLQCLYLENNQLSGQFFYFSGWSVPTDHLNLTDFSLIFCFLIHQRRLALTHASTNPSHLSSSSITDTQAARAYLVKCLSKSPQCDIDV
jgi:hypothetical protein